MNPALKRGRRSTYQFVGSARCWRTLTIAAIIILLPARGGVSQTSASYFVIRNARVFDGEKIIPNASVVVADGKITAVGSNIKAPSDAQVVDGTGDTLLPGLIDSHVHVWTRDVLE